MFVGWCLLVCVTMWFLLQVIGCIVLAVGVFLSADQLSFVPKVFLTPLLNISSVLIVSAGCLVFLLTMVGCLGIYLLNQHAVLGVWWQNEFILLKVWLPYAITGIIYMHRYMLRHLYVEECSYFCRSCFCLSFCVSSYWDKKLYLAVWDGPNLDPDPGIFFTLFNMFNIV